MIPITRKENYLNEIVGWGETAPEKPLTPEEFFFAAILGEAVQTPEPLSRYQIYLAKIAGRNISVPKPLTRLELFLAKTCGMDIEIPTPITREEIFWSNYSAIVDFEFEGVPPLSFKAKAGTLKDYKIYGNTVDGESVGDLETTGEHAGEYKVPVTVEGKNLWSGAVEQGAVSIIGDYEDSSKRIRSKNIPLEPGTYKLTSNLLVRMIFAYHDSTKFGKMFDVADGSENPSFTVPEGANNISIAMMKLVDGAQVDITPEDFEYGQIEKGSEATPYESYQPPITTPIYLPEQIKKVGDEAEYIDYGEQKLHRIGADDIDVTLPALPTLPGTNVLSVGTAVQPSKVYVKGQKERD